jgi:MFS family permease
MANEHDPYAALRYPNYCLLLSGGTLASIGMGIQTVAVGYEIYQRTHSAWLLGLTGLAQFLPVLFFALPAGQAADHFSRKVLFQLAVGTSALASVGLAMLSWYSGPVWLYFACLFLTGTARAFGAPSRQALLPEVVPLEVLPNAVTWNTTGWQFASISGPAVGGLLLANVSTAATYAVTAGSLLICALLMLFVRPVRQARHPTPRSLAALFAGLRFVFQTDLLLAAISLDLFAVLLGGATALLPVFAEDILNIGPTGLGVLRAAPAIGAMVMAILMAHRPPLRRPGLALLLAVAGFGLATIGFGLSRNMFLSFAMLFLTGALDNISVVVRHTLMQMLTPDEMRGRVAAVTFVFISSSNELGEFESGATAHLFGPVASVVGGGIGTILVVLVVLSSWPRLLRLGPLHTLGEHREVSPPGSPSSG